MRALKIAGWVLLTSVLSGLGLSFWSKAFTSSYDDFGALLAGFAVSLAVWAWLGAWRSMRRP